MTGPEDWEERAARAEAKVARVLALADTWEAQAEATMASDRVLGTLLLVDAQALRRAIDGDQPDEGAHSDYVHGASS